MKKISLEDCVESMESGLKKKSSKSNDLSNNGLGAFLGVSVVVLLEGISPTGSIGSMITAGVVGSITATMLNEYTDSLPDSKLVSFAEGVASGYAGMKAGRLYASYFPGGRE